MTGRGYEQIKTLPHVGAVLYSDDEAFDERLQRLLRGLHQELQRRLRLIAEHKVDTVFAYNQAHPDRPLPGIVLVIDNFVELFLVCARPDRKPPAPAAYPLLRGRHRLGQHQQHAAPACLSPC